MQIESAKLKMISGESNFMDTQQIQHQMKIDEDTEIIVTHHRLYLYFVFAYGPISSIQK